MTRFIKIIGGVIVAIVGLPVWIVLGTAAGVCVFFQECVLEKPYSWKEDYEKRAKSETEMFNYVNENLKKLDPYVNGEKYSFVTLTQKGDPSILFVTLQNDSGFTKEFKLDEVELKERVGDVSG